MAAAQFTFTTLPTPTEVALKWVETARKGSKAWTDACLLIVATFSDVAQTQAKVIKSLTPPMIAPAEALPEAPPAPVEMLAEPPEALAEVVEAMPPVEATPVAVEAPSAPVPAPKVETPPAPAPVLKATVTVEPLATPIPAAKTASPAIAKPVAAKAAKPTAKKT
jgi:hypothetical protein